MRVTDAMLSGGVIADLQSAELSAMEQQAILASGKRINQPSDDPAGASLALQFSAQISRLQQYQANVNDGQNWLNATDSALQNASDILRQAQSIVLSGSNATEPATAQASLATQMGQLIQSLKDAANSQLGGRYLFAGQNTLQAAYVQSGTTITYQGNAGAINREIAPGQTLAINLVGSATYGTVFSDLQAAQADLQAGNTAALSGTDLPQLQADLNTLLAQRAVAGAAMNRLTAALNNLQTVTTGVQGLLSQTQDADVASTIIHFQQQQQTYQLALGAASRLIQPSLMDFLH